MAQDIYLQTPTDDIDMDVFYFDKLRVDSCGMDFFYGSDSVDSSVSFDGIDKHALCYSILGDESGDWPENAYDLHDAFSNPEEFSDIDLEHMAHAALRVLAERAAA